MTNQALRPFMYGKIHRATVTDANLHYVGSITIDPALLRAAHLIPHTQVDVVNITNGARIQTYIIEGPENGGDICLNGAAAHHFNKGDLVIIMGYEMCPVDALTGRISRAVHVDGQNRILNVAEHTTPALEDIGQPENNRLGEVYS